MDRHKFQLDAMRNSSCFFRSFFFVCFKTWIRSNVPNHLSLSLYVMYTMSAILRTKVCGGRGGGGGAWLHDDFELVVGGLHGQEQLSSHRWAGARGRRRTKTMIIFGLASRLGDRRREKKSSISHGFGNSASWCVCVCVTVCVRFVCS